MLVEFAAVTSVLATFVGGLLLATYLLFAHAWIQFQGEQALYCVAQGSAPSQCRRQLSHRLKVFLPWGELRRDEVAIREEPEKVADIYLEWTCFGYHLHLKRELSAKIILKNRVMRW